MLYLRFQQAVVLGCLLALTNWVYAQDDEVEFGKLFLGPVVEAIHSGASPQTKEQWDLYLLYSSLYHSNFPYVAQHDTDSWSSLRRIMATEHEKNPTLAKRNLDNVYVNFSKRVMSGNPEVLKEHVNAVNDYFKLQLSALDLSAGPWTYLSLSKMKTKQIEEMLGEVYKAAKEIASRESARDSSAGDASKVKTTKSSKTAAASLPELQSWIQQSELNYDSFVTAIYQYLGSSKHQDQVENFAKWFSYLYAFKTLDLNSGSPTDFARLLSTVEDRWQSESLEVFNLMNFDVTKFAAEFELPEQLKALRADLVDVRKQAEKSLVDGNDDLKIVRHIKSLVELAGQSTVGGHCVTLARMGYNTYPLNGFYEGFTITNPRNGKSAGFVSIMIFTRKGDVEAPEKVAVVDFINNIPTDHIAATFYAIEKAIGLPLFIPNALNHLAFTNTVSITNFVEREFKPYAESTVKYDLKNYELEKHPYKPKSKYGSNISHANKIVRLDWSKMDAPFIKKVNSIPSIEMPTTTLDEFLTLFRTMKQGSESERKAFYTSNLSFMQDTNLKQLIDPDVYDLPLMFGRIETEKRAVAAAIMRLYVLTPDSNLFDKFITFLRRTSSRDLAETYVEVANGIMNKEMYLLNEQRASDLFAQMSDLYLKGFVKDGAISKAKDALFAKYKEKSSKDAKLIENYQLRCLMILADHEHFEQLILKLPRRITKFLELADLSLKDLIMKIDPLLALLVSNTSRLSATERLEHYERFWLSIASLIKSSWGGYETRLDIASTVFQVIHTHYREWTFSNPDLATVIGRHLEDSDSMLSRAATMLQDTMFEYMNDTNQKTSAAMSLLQQIYWMNELEQQKMAKLLKNMSDPEFEKFAGDLFVRLKSVGQESVEYTPVELFLMSSLATISPIWIFSVVDENKKIIMFENLRKYSHGEYLHSSTAEMLDHLISYDVYRLSQVVDALLQSYVGRMGGPTNALNLSQQMVERAKKMSRENLYFWNKPSVEKKNASMMIVLIETLSSELASVKSVGSRIAIKTRLIEQLSGPLTMLMKQHPEAYQGLEQYTCLQHFGLLKNEGLVKGGIPTALRTPLVARKSTSLPSGNSEAVGVLGGGFESFKRVWSRDVKPMVDEAALRVQAYASEQLAKFRAAWGGTPSVPVEAAHEGTKTGEPSILRTKANEHEGAAERAAKASEGTAAGVGKGDGPRESNPKDAALSESKAGVGNEARTLQALPGTLSELIEAMSKLTAEDPALAALVEAYVSRASSMASSQEKISGYVALVRAAQTVTWMKKAGVGVASESSKFMTAMTVAVVVSMLRDSGVTAYDLLKMFENTPGHLHHLLWFSLGAGSASTGYQILARGLERKLYEVTSKELQAQLAGKAAGPLARSFAIRHTASIVGMFVGIALSKWRFEGPSEHFWPEVFDELSGFIQAKMLVAPTVAGSKIMINILRTGKWSLKAFEASNPVGWLLAAVELGLDLYVMGKVSDAKARGHMHWQLGRDVYAAYTALWSWEARRQRLKLIDKGVHQEYKFETVRNHCDQKKTDEEYGLCLYEQWKLKLNQYMQQVGMWHTAKLVGKYQVWEEEEHQKYGVQKLGETYLVLPDWRGENTQDLKAAHGYASGLSRNMAQYNWAAFKAKRDKVMDPWNKVKSPVKRFIEKDLRPELKIAQDLPEACLGKLNIATVFVCQELLGIKYAMLSQKLEDKLWDVKLSEGKEIYENKIAWLAHELRRRQMWEREYLSDDNDKHNTVIHPGEWMTMVLYQVRELMGYAKNRKGEEALQSYASLADIMALVSQWPEELSMESKDVTVKGPAKISTGFDPNVLLSARTWPELLPILKHARGEKGTPACEGMKMPVQSEKDLYNVLSGKTMTLVMSQDPDLETTAEHHGREMMMYEYGLRTACIDLSLKQKWKIDTETPCEQVLEQAGVPETQIETRLNKLRQEIWHEVFVKNTEAQVELTTVEVRAKRGTCDVKEEGIESCALRPTNLLQEDPCDQTLNLFVHDAAILFSGLVYTGYQSPMTGRPILRTAGTQYISKKQLARMRDRIAQQLAIR